MEVIKDRKVVAIAVGIVPEKEKSSLRSYEQIPTHIREKIKFFKIPGWVWLAKPAGEVKKENLNRIIRYVRNVVELNS